MLAPFTMTISMGIWEVGGVKRKSVEVGGGQ